MSKNKANFTLSERLPRAVADLKQQVRDAKSPQSIGADVIEVQGVPDSGYLLAGPLTLGAGVSGVFNIAFIPNNETLTLWNIMDSLCVDTTANDHQWPSGAALTADQLKLRRSMWWDWGDSSDITNTRVYKVNIENYDASPHDYYLKLRAYLPKLTGSGLF